MTTAPPQRLDSALVWFRRDLRCADHAALYHALRQARRVWCVFVLDRTILDDLPGQDRRVSFIVDSLQALDDGLKNLQPQAGLMVLHGNPLKEIPALAQRLGVQAVYTNHDDDPYAISRDKKVRGALSHIGVALYTSKDAVVFEREEVLTANLTPFSVFTPYKNAWLKKINDFYLKAYPVETHAAHLAALPAAWQNLWASQTPSLAEIGFEPTTDLKLPTGMTGAQTLFDDFLSRIDQYDSTRNFPAIKGPSYLSTHLRFGTISIRRLAREAWARAQQGSQGAQTWLSELIWRDFYHQILWHHPRVTSSAFKPAYDRIKWAHGKQADAHFLAWCEGKTGYPLVDAAMRQLNQTGYMHNRLRMVTACFLVKDLGIDWRRGEAYFAQHLLDFDLAANNGGWQWAASTGCDAQPYFRIFNPITQSEKFDPHGKFIRRYVPELAGLPDKALHAPWLARPIDIANAQPAIVLGKTYPHPVVQHDEARQATLARYAVVKSSGSA